MEPAFHRGDLLFLTNYEHEDIRVGEIVVFKVSSHFDKSYIHIHMYTLYSVRTHGLTDSNFYYMKILLNNKIIEHLNITFFAS